MTSQNVYVSTVGQVQLNMYSGAIPYKFEEVRPADKGFGARLTVVRIYRTSPTAAFTGDASTGSEEVKSFSTGHIPHVSVSNITDSGFTWNAIANTTTFDSSWSSLFDRIFALPFDQPVTTINRASVGTTSGSKNLTGNFTFADVGATISGTGIGAGATIVSQTFTGAVLSSNATATGSITASIVQGICAPFVYFTVQHEVDRPSPHGIHTADAKTGTVATTAQWIAAWQKLYTLSHARAAAAGVSPNRIRWVWCCTAYGFNQNRCDAFYPGTAFVDVIGSDIYNGFDGHPVAWNAANAGTIAFCRAKSKHVCYPEASCYTQTSGSNYAATWWADAAVQINATPDVPVEFINLWMAGTNFASNYWQYNFNTSTSDDQGPSPSTHDNSAKKTGLIAMLATFGNNAIFTATSQGQPSAPANVVATSSSDGTQMSITWNANASLDNITGWDVYIAQGNTSNLKKVNTSGPLPVSPRIFTFAGLSPGTQYSMAVVAINSAGRSGFSNPITVKSTSVPGPSNHSPSIVAAAVVVHSDDPTTFDFTASATDPDGDPLTFVWTVSGAGTVNMFSGAAITEQFVAPGVYDWTLTVSDDGSPPLSVSQSGTFNVILGQANTTNFNWPIPQPGIDIRLLSLYLRGILPDLDMRLGTAMAAKAPHLTLTGLVGSTMDPAMVSGGTVVTPSNGSTLWAGLVVQGGNSITALELQLTQALVGTPGCQISFHDINGQLMTFDGTVNGTPAVITSGVDAWLAGSITVPSVLTLSTPLTGIPYNTIIYVQFFFPTMSTPPKLLSGTAGGATALSGTNNRRWGAIATKTQLDTLIPFASGTNIPLPYVGAIGA